MPAITEWSKYFPYQAKAARIAIHNPKSAKKLAEAFIPEGSVGKVVIESYPGEFLDLYREESVMLLT